MRKRAIIVRLSYNDYTESASLSPLIRLSLMACWDHLHCSLNSICTLVRGQECQHWQEMGACLATTRLTHCYCLHYLETISVHELART